MKNSRVASNALNNPKAGYSQLARLEPTAFERRSRRLQLTALEQLSKVLEAKQENRPAHKKADTTETSASSLKRAKRRQSSRYLFWPAYNASPQREPSIFCMPPVTYVLAMFVTYVLTSDPPESSMWWPELHNFVRLLVRTGREA